MKVKILCAGLVFCILFCGCKYYYENRAENRKKIISEKGSGMNEKKLSGLQSIAHSRASKLHYPTDITKEEAEAKADNFKDNGVTHVLTDDNRYIMYDLKDKNNPPEFHFVVTSREESIQATKRVADALHSRGLYCIHHITCSYATKDLMEQHKDWTQRDARYPDKPLFFEMYGGVYLFCLNNPGFREEFFNTVVDISKRTGVDGWMIDEVEWLPNWYSCGCARCRELFKNETGFELPTTPDSPVWENFENPVWKAWLRWRMKSAGDFFVDLKKRLDAEVPGLILTACHAGASDTWLAQKWGQDIIELRRGLNWVFFEAYIRDDAEFYNWRRYLAELRLYAAIAKPTNNPAFALFYPNSDKEAGFCRGLSSTAGVRLWSEMSDSESKCPVYFVWQREHEFLFDNKKEFSNIALLYSKQTRDGYAGIDAAFYVNEWGGWAETLNEQRIPHTMIIEDDLTNGGISEFGLVIIPHAVCLSDEQICALQNYQSKGGKLIISGETGMRDEKGNLRSDTSAVYSLMQKSVYIPGKPGVKSELNYVRMFEQFIDKREPEPRNMIINTVKAFDKNLSPYSVEAPLGVVANAFILKDGTIAIHLLNATAATPPDKTVIPGKSGYSASFPEVKDIRISIKKSLVKGTFNYAYKYSSCDSEKTKLDFIQKFDEYIITVPTLELYSVIHVTEN